VNSAYLGHEVVRGSRVDAPSTRCTGTSSLASIMRPELSVVIFTPATWSVPRGRKAAPGP